MSDKKRIIVAITGASGAIIGIEVLKALQTQKQIEIETHLLISTLGSTTISQETTYSVEEIKQMADVFHPLKNLASSIASGSFQTSGMIVVPCSMKTLGGIASGYSDNLILRAADVCLKERRKLVLVPRETPLNGIHLKNLTFMHEQGAVILPAMMTFYHKPQSIDEMVHQLVGRILNQFDIPYEKFQPWQG